MAQTEHDRRRESRALTAALIQMTDEHEDISTCVLEDLSCSGACIHSDIALQVGKQVQIKAASVIHAGVVKYCRPDNEGFTIGIQFVGGKWPSPIGYPIHWIRAEHH